MKIENSIILIFLLFLIYSCENTEVFKDKPVINFKKSDGYVYQDTIYLSLGQTIRAGVYVSAQGEGNQIMDFKIEKIEHLDSLITILDTIPKKQNLNIDFLITQNQVDTTIWIISAMDKSDNLTEVKLQTFLKHD